MKKTQFKDCIRNIRKQCVSFISILVITLLGITAYLGIDFTARAMRRNGSDLYNDLNFRDIETVSTLLFTEQDFESFRNIEGVADVEKVRFTNAKATFGDLCRDVGAISLTERINRIVLTDGRLPQTPDECVVEQCFADEVGLRPGDKIRLLNSDGETAEFLGVNEVTVTGIGKTPDHVNSLIDEQPYIFLRWDAFDTEQLRDCFMKAEIVVQKPENTDRFSKQYKETVASVLEKIDELAADRTVMRNVEAIVDGILTAENLPIPEEWLANLYEQITKRSAPRKEDSTYNVEAIKTELRSSVMEWGEQYREFVEEFTAWYEKNAPYIEELSAYLNISSSFTPCRWISYGMNGNASFVQMSVGSSNFANLKKTFSTLFVFVGALVIFATVGKIVDEQRTLVGTTKALGFFNREIFVKYLGFGVSAVALGALLGMVVARFFIEPFLLTGFGNFYYFEIAKPLFFTLPSVIAFLAGILLAIVAIWFACSKLLREPAIRLMQAKAPGVKKGFGGKRGLSLYSRLILLNMRTDIKRVIVTIVSVAGCCALVIIGFTIRSSVQEAPKKQYEEIVTYDVCATYDPNVSALAGSKIETVLQSFKTEYLKVYKSDVTYRIDGLQIAELICGDLEKINEYHHLNDWKTGKALTPTDEGVFIPRRVAEIYGLKVGDEMELSLGGVRPGTVRIAGIFENYIGKSIFLSEKYFKTIYGRSALQPNTFLVQLRGADADSLEKSMHQIDGFEVMTRADTDKSIIESSTSMINTVVLLFILIAAVLAGVVQMNLTNMYILQKRRELIIMRVNGFSTKEVVNYVLRETVVTTVCGILFGLAAGSALAHWIVRTLEQEFIRFGRGIDLIAWLIAIGMTILFTVIVNAIALRDVRHLKLTDIA